MPMRPTQFKPNYATHPGQTLQEVLVHIGMTQKDLAERTGLTEKHLSEIVQEKSPITSETALKFEFALSIEAAFWLGLQTHFDETTTRLKAEADMSIYIDEAAKYPYAEMAQLGWVEKVRDAAKKVENLLRFFGVNEFSSIRHLHSAAFRKSNAFASSPEALAAWLRKGEIEAQNTSVASFDKDSLIKFLPEVRKMTLEKPPEYSKRLEEGLAKCGVALVVLPHLKQTRANGATQWLSKDKVIVQVSLRNKAADIFWFSLFHEIGHVLKHGKKETHIQSKDAEGEQKSDEEEADTFASDTLIPTNAYFAFIKQEDFSQDGIRRFAKDVQIHPGIVVGRLQHERLVHHKNLNSLKEKYDWVTKATA